MHSLAPRGPSAGTVTVVFRHVVIFQWTAEATDAAKRAAADALNALAQQVPSVRDYRFGPDAGLADANWDFVVVADFDDEAGYTTYRDHPAHRALIADVLQPIVAQRAGVQYRLDH